MRMSRNFSWFLRVVIYLPLTISALLLAVYFYVNNAFDVTLTTCLGEQKLNPEKVSRDQVYPFVQCLQRRNNFLVSDVMREERLYQYRNPRTPCQLVGQWSASHFNQEYVYDLQADSRFNVYTVNYLNREAASNRKLIKSGVWSSSGDSLLQFPDNTYIWPLHEASLKWMDSNHFIFKDDSGDPVYFFRTSPQLADCKYHS